MVKKLLLSLIFIIYMASLCYAAPFGFEKGMSLATIKKLVGNENVEKKDINTYLLKKAPKPHSFFKTFVVEIGPSFGLVKIIALSENISTSIYGTELKSKFEDIEESLKKKYGTPSDEFDFLRAGSIWNEPKDWMIGLLKKERILVTVWKNKGDISILTIEANPRTRNSGYISLTYEFDTF